MVGRGARGMPTRSRRRLPKKLILGSQGLDGGRACPGLDQHENYSRCGLLLYRNPNRRRQTLARKRSHGPPVEA